MYEIRIHGRGGQGAVTAAEIIAIAAFKQDEQYTQASPFFGAERRGAPVMAFVRIGNKPIRLRSQIYEPDCVIVLDPTLLTAVNVLAGLKKDGIIILNSKEEVFLGIKNEYYVDATKIALDTLGMAITNVPMLGAFARIMNEKYKDKIQISLDDLNRTIEEKFAGKSKKIAEKNVEAAKKTYEEVKPISEKMKELADKCGEQFRKRMAETLQPPEQVKVTLAIAPPGSTIKNKTGGWRTLRPVADLSKCIGCGICKQYCPEPCIQMKDKKPVIDYDYCKGCGICADECPEEAIKMEIEMADDKFNRLNEIRKQIEKEFII